MKTSNAAELRFIEQLGQQAQNDGISRIAGQIWAALIISDGPVSSGELMDLLHISKGSVSTNTRMLEMMHIVERRSKPGERQDYFSIRQNPYSALVEGQLKRFQTAKTVVAEAKAGITNARAQAKLADLDRFYTLYFAKSEALLEELKSAPETGEI